MVNASGTYTLTVEYSQDEVVTAIENTLGLYYWNGNQWQLDAGSALDSTANTVIAMPDQLGFWAVLGETNRVYLPVIGR